MRRGVLQLLLLLLLACWRSALSRQPQRRQRPSIVTMNDHAEALPVWVRAAATAGLPPAPYAVLHVDRHSDMNMPSRLFTATPVGQQAAGANPEAERQRVAALRAAAVHEADLASFQMVGAWVGVVSNIVWIHGNSSEPFMVTCVVALKITVS